MMDPVLLARIQFAITIGFHYIFPPLTIGMAWVIVLIKWKALKTGDPVYASMGRFWTKVFAISFAIGVASGIVMEFQFGTNWAKYSRFVGDIFGAPLAAEGLFSFFLESSFLGVLLFGEKRVSPRMHWFASLMVAVGATLSAFWIIVANSWQQTPAGYHLVNGRAELTDFWAALFNPSTMPRYLHTIDGALVDGSFFIMGISALFLLRQRHVEFARRSFRIALIVAFVGSVAQLPLGHYHAEQVADTQPAKLAAFEGLFESQDNAPLLIFGIPNVEQRRVDYALGIPGGLSMLAMKKRVQGLNDFPEDEWPPIMPSFMSFHLMVGLGMAFIGFTTWGIFLLWRKKLYDSKLFVTLALWITPIPMLCNQLGWMAAEIGRQPWVVYGLMRTKDGISVSVPAGQILFSIILFSSIYALLFGVWIFLLRKKLQKGPDVGEAQSAATEVAA